MSVWLLLSADGQEASTGHTKESNQKKSNSSKIYVFMRHKERPTRPAHHAKPRFGLYVNCFISVWTARKKRQGQTNENVTARIPGGIFLTLGAHADGCVVHSWVGVPVPGNDTAAIVDLLPHVVNHTASVGWGSLIWSIIYCIFQGYVFCRVFLKIYYTCEYCLYEKVPLFQQEVNQKNRQKSFFNSFW